MNLADLKEAVILIGLIALIGSAIAISLDAFKDDVGDTCATGFTYNGSGTSPCCSNSNCSGSTSWAYNSTIDGEEGVYNTTSFLDTIGTILGVSVLIGLVVMAFSFGNR